MNKGDENKWLGRGEGASMDIYTFQVAITMN